VCGIVGIVGRNDVAKHLVDALKRLEYRGYDSAGIAIINNSGIVKLREEGKIANLDSALSNSPISGSIGIGHTRWATHGAPSKRNAHPHTTSKVAVVHNGIIENFQALKSELIHAGYEFKSDTDSEVIAVLIHSQLDKGKSPRNAVLESLKLLHGAYAVAIVFAGEENLLIGARKGSPLAIGYGDGEMYLGSDSIALAPFTTKISYLEEGDMAVLSATSAEFIDKNGAIANREIRISTINSSSIGKGGYRHYMLKEIYEQPTAIGETLNAYINPVTGMVVMPEEVKNLNQIERIFIVACGTSFYAGSVASYWLEKLCRIPCEVHIASEFRYRNPVLSKNSLGIFISQSGETADTLAALRLTKEHGIPTIAIVNSHESTMAFEADAKLPTCAGPEIGVASTKAFTTQLAVLSCLAIKIAAERGLIKAHEQSAMLRSLLEIPTKISEILSHEQDIQKIAYTCSKAQDIIYMGRGACFAIALEGALKLKEISYIHAEGFAAGELKHGPIALIDENVPVIAIAPTDELFDKTASNIQEVAARGGKVMLFSSSKGVEQMGAISQHIFEIPDGDFLSNPILYSIPVQLLSYHVAVIKGTDVDQPRNLAKSVTVE